jgi:hypothetical protein
MFIWLLLLFSRPVLSYDRVAIYDCDRYCEPTLIAAFNSGDRSF